MPTKPTQKTKNAINANPRPFTLLPSPRHYPGSLNALYTHRQAEELARLQAIQNMENALNWSLGVSFWNLPKSQRDAIIRQNSVNYQSK